MQQQQQQQQQQLGFRPAQFAVSRKTTAMLVGQGSSVSRTSITHIANGKRNSRIFYSCQAKTELWRSMEVNGSNLKRGRRLGQGSYAEVYKGRLNMSRAMGIVDCAIKVYRSTASEKQLKEAMREIQLAASLDHPCTLRLLAWANHPLQTITELCRGDLQAFYKDKIEGFTYSEARALDLLRASIYLFVPSLLCYLLRCSFVAFNLNLQRVRCTSMSLQDSAAGLLYLHNVGIIHRDIKPGNILIGGKANNAKIADFGISRIADTDAAMTIKGTLVYQAPEVSRGERYGFAADVYSFALTMYEVCDRVRILRSENADISHGLLLWIFAQVSNGQLISSSFSTLPGYSVYEIGTGPRNQARSRRCS